MAQVSALGLFCQQNWKNIFIPQHRPVANKSSLPWAVALFDIVLLIMVAMLAISYLGFDYS